MRRPFLLLGIITLSAGLLLFLFALSLLGSRKVEPVVGTNAESAVTQEKPTVVFGNPTRGPNNAKVTIVEFGDFECGPCAELEAALAEVLKNHSADVRLVWKDFPNESIHANSMVAAQAARCAGSQGKFWEFHDLLLANQSSLSSANMNAFADQLNLNAGEFQTCLDGGTMRPVVERDLEEGLRLRVDGTPYLFINDKRVSGTISSSQLNTIIESLLPIK